MQRLILKFLLFLLLAPNGFGQTKHFLVEKWRGELFQRRQGGIIVGMGLKNFPSNVRSLSSPVRILLDNVLRKTTHELTYQMTPSGKSHFHYWKLKSGKYRLKSISLVDGEGNKRTFLPSKTRFILVKRQSLSNLGIWILRPLGNQQLSLGIKKVANPYKGQDGSEESVAFVIDGFTGMQQAAVSGKQVQTEARREHSTEDRLRATFTTTRQIAMFFKLNLLQHNQHARGIANVLKAHDSKLRECYTDRLDEVPNLKGTVKFSVLLSPKTQSMRRVARSGGSLADGALASCLALHLQGIDFPVPTTMVGTLEYDFSWR